MNGKFKYTVHSVEINKSVSACSVLCVSNKTRCPQSDLMILLCSSPISCFDRRHNILSQNAVSL